MQDVPVPPVSEDDVPNNNLLKMIDAGDDVFELVQSDALILRQTAENFDFANPPFDPIVLATKLANTMIKKGAYGIAAPQVGLPFNVFVIGNPGDKEATCMAFFNTTIVDSSKEEEYYEEGCLSYPNLFLKVKRPSSIRLRFTNMHNDTNTSKFTGLTARIIQHEYDHIRGVVFKDRASLHHLQQAKTKRKKLNRQNKRAQKESK